MQVNMSNFHNVSQTLLRGTVRFVRHLILHQVHPFAPGAALKNILEAQFRAGEAATKWLEFLSSKMIAPPVI